MIVVVKLDSKAFYVRILIWLFFRCPDRIIPSLFKMIRPRIIKIKDTFLASFWSLWSSFLANNHYQPISSNPSNREREKREREKERKRESVVLSELHLLCPPLDCSHFWLCCSFQPSLNIDRTDLLSNQREFSRRHETGARGCKYCFRSRYGGNGRWYRWEQTDKELTSTILTTPQTLNSTERETVNQLAIKARDSLEKKKKVSKASSKKNKKSGSSPRGTSR